ncbi:hypothetical protein TIFTF001_053046 [Ficus carica]|uniref:Uncharacterized protein n=1 Tax=Ficus carica TaxID=3494 RepID=A0AA88JII5_FICCA|nr:hypothetical protein TIFTF001_053046 [Ficus carica]
MELFMRRQIFITVAAVVTTVIALHTSYQCGATTDTASLKSVGNSTASICVGSAGECLVAQQDPDLEFQMPSENSRRILAGAGGTTSCAQNPKCAGGCGSTGSTCTGLAGTKYRNNCGQYNRNCPTNP